MLVRSHGERRISASEMALTAPAKQLLRSGLQRNEEGRADSVQARRTRRPYDTALTGSRCASRRGRRGEGRAWVSVAGRSSSSPVLYVAWTRRRRRRRLKLSYFVALAALCRSARSDRRKPLAGLGPSLKWPNDVAGRGAGTSCAAYCWEIRHGARRRAVAGRSGSAFNLRRTIAEEYGGRPCDEPCRPWVGKRGPGGRPCRASGWRHHIRYIAVHAGRRERVLIPPRYGTLGLPARTGVRARRKRWYGPGLGKGGEKKPRAVGKGICVAGT